MNLKTRKIVVIFFYILGLVAFGFGIYLFIGHLGGYNVEASSNLEALLTIPFFFVVTIGGAIMNIITMGMNTKWKNLFFTITPMVETLALAAMFLIVFFRFMSTL